MMCFSTTEDGCSYGRNVLKKHQDFNRVSSSQFLPTKSVLSMEHLKRIKKLCMSFLFL